MEEVTHPRQVGVGGKSSHLFSIMNYEKMQELPAPLRPSTPTLAPHCVQCSAGVLAP